MKWVSLLLVLLWLIDGLRLRARLQRMPVLPPSKEDVATEHVCLLAPKVSLLDSVKRDASAWMRARGLLALDLVPGDLPVEPLIGLLQALDFAAHRQRPFAQGRTAGHAMLVRRDVLRVAGIRSTRPERAAEFAELAIRIKRQAPRAMGHALAEELVAQPVHVRELRSILETLIPGFANAILTGQLILLMSMLFLAIWTPWGLLALAAFQLQPLIVVAGQRVRPKDFGRTLALRWPLSAASWFVTATSPRRVETSAEAKRNEYDELLANGLDRFFEPRRGDCPNCGGAELTVEVETPDLLQHKPGRFVLERCRGCGHLFQNPRLSSAGLDFYYRDFYDGFGERSTEGVFGSSMRSYLARAEMLSGVGRPERWLDVGGGHGHFALAAKGVWPETRFDGLDQSTSIVTAEKRGWVERGYQGRFVELAAELRGYDVLSMSHYLEHTRDPRSEIAAAAEVLSEGAHLIIEVPDPDSRMRTILRRYWLPYFQPQHQHLMPAANLERLLRQHGFEPLVWHRGLAHQPVDLFVAACMLVNSIAGMPDRPWRPKPTGLDRIRRVVVWMGLFWLLPLGWFGDRMVARFLARKGWSNTYRVLARRATVRSHAMPHPRSTHGSSMRI